MNKIKSVLLFMMLVFFILSSTPAEEAKLSVIERLNARDFPSLFAAWAGCHYIPPDANWTERRHDLVWGHRIPEGRFEKIDGKIVLTGDVEAARERWSEHRRYNPNMIFLMDIPFPVAPLEGSKNTLFGEIFPDDWPFMIIDETGEEVLGFTGDHVNPQSRLIDFTHIEAQKVIVGLAKAVDDSEFFDGIFIDWWDETGLTLDGYRTLEEEFEARIHILQSIRDIVSDDFLIVVNSNHEGAKHAAPYINGVFRETFRHAMPDNFEHLSMMWFEEGFRWVESECRFPQITCFEAEGVGDQSPMSAENLQAMRCLTALYLTHSDGFFTYTMGINLRDRQNHVHDSHWVGGPDHDDLHARSIVHEHHHEHYCYDFWYADLGRPIGAKFQLYENTDGLFIREFDNGWAVYNRSGVAQTVRLPRSTGVSSQITDTEHTIPDLDGEIYLKSTGEAADLNSDGVVNILDLVLVANAFGEATPDLNGDGVVNILDLVIVANNFADN